MTLSDEPIQGLPMLSFKENSAYALESGNAMVH
jgi:hypothetical protein